MTKTKYNNKTRSKIINKEQSQQTDLETDYLLPKKVIDPAFNITTADGIDENESWCNNFVDLEQHKATKSKLGLGTAQFGLDYGISNKNGRIPSAEIKNILSLAKKANISVIDTAPAYGISERVLGENLTDANWCSIITKTKSLNTKEINEQELIQVEEAFTSSLKRLKKDKIYAVLVHAAQDLLVKGGDLLFAKLKSWQADDKIKKIGVSVYNKTEINEMRSRYKLDLFQIPVNIFDQRLYLDGTIEELAKEGVEIHARSVFLQGLLLMPLNNLPHFFHPIKKHLQNYHTELKNQNITPLTAALSFLQNIKAISTILVGVESARHLQECLQGLHCPINIDFAQFAISDLCYLDPRLWKF